jgi:hypothetical protein
LCVGWLIKRKTEIWINTATGCLLTNYILLNLVKEHILTIKPRGPDNLLHCSSPLASESFVVFSLIMDHLSDIWMKTMRLLITQGYQEKTKKS